jgi:undecaprenyl diphosphate synthase
MSEPIAPIPNHLGIILDGNRRWAKNNGLPTSEGHREGFETFSDIADYALERGVKYLSIYAFSTENWARSKDEVNFLMGFMKTLIKTRIKELHKKGVRFVWFGTTEKLDEKIIAMFREAEELTAQNTSATLALCFNYGGKQEIVDAVHKIQATGGAVTAESIESNLYGGADIPPVDFLIRTSGEHRISNFMLWRAAYSELYFTDVLWPNFSVQELDKALAEYAQRQRRFGS